MESNDESEDRAAKRRRLGEEEIMKRREKRLWEDKRNKLLFEYSQFTYYAKAVITFRRFHFSLLTLFYVLECNCHVRFGLESK